MNEPTVSVVVVTYNHQEYIKQCLDAILSQKTNFDFELIIGEDASSDDTRKICQFYQDKYPSIIRLYLRSGKYKIWINGKVTGRLNFIESLKSARGKYIAICEGDDYWSDELKLQKQVDFLEKNPDCGICFHEVQVFHQATEKLIPDTITREVPKITTITELASGNYIHTPSVMIRNNFKIPKWFAKAPTGDWTLYMIAAGNQKICKLNETMAVYREHQAGIWSGVQTAVKARMTLDTFQMVHDKLELPKQAKENLASEITRLEKYLGLTPIYRPSLKKRLKSKLRPLYNFLKWS